jgi:hypothetical protein
MADKFCIHCGDPLTGVKRFCANCGSPVGGDPGGKERAPVLDGQILTRLSANIRMPAPTPLLSRPAPPPKLASPLSGLRATAPARARLRAAGASAPAPDKVVFDRVTEPNDNAFTVAVPRGWQIRGGIFYVNPLQVNGPGNALAPKCDFAVMSDDPGTIMLRWIPSWNYADLTNAPAGGAFFPPGEWYQGMPVRLMVSARQFLWEMLQAERPKATGMTIAAEDPLDEITAACYKQAEAYNQGLQQAGLAPWKFASWDMRVEYTEEGQLYWEEVATTICDNRAVGFAWWNDYTFMMRAPASVFVPWGYVLMNIRNSLELSQQWLAAVEKARGQNARLAWETQQYINQVTAEIIAKRQQAYEEAERNRGQEQ